MQQLSDLQRYTADTALSDSVERDRRGDDASLCEMLQAKPGETWLRLEGMRRSPESVDPICHTEVYIQPAFRSLTGIEGRAAHADLHDDRAAVRRADRAGAAGDPRDGDAADDRAPCQREGAFARAVAVAAVISTSAARSSRRRSAFIPPTASVIRRRSSAAGTAPDAPMIRGETRMVARSYLFVPGDRPERFAKALASARASGRHRSGRCRVARCESCRARRRLARLACRRNYRTRRDERVVMVACQCFRHAVA